MKRAVKRILTVFFSLVISLGTCFALGSCSLFSEYETRYETEISFFVNPKKEGDAEDGEYKVYGSYGEPVMNNMIGLLESDAFTLLLLQGQALAPKETLEDGTKNPVFEEWAKSYDYVRYFVGAKEGIEYYYSSETNEDESLSRSCIEVKIIAEEREIAEIFLEGIKETLPPYVEENMVIPSGYDGTRCVKVSLFEEIKEVRTKKNQSLIF